MSANVTVDSTLLAEALQTVGLASDRATIEEALRQLIANHRRRLALEDLWGIGWEGDLDAMRTDIEVDERG